MNYVEAWPWLLVVLGGPIALFIALAWSRTRAGRTNKRIDPATPGDDPSKGL
ncbi:hypothetical protein [Brevundimonas balnearis]|uniref:Uncharacterized protein n=1 Tax=Brevundimonas balnearis TaxID=1572858 RepID=A0ABV6R1J8_9CAUL